jgi:hypothetical protein
MRVTARSSMMVSMARATTGAIIAICQALSGDLVKSIGITMLTELDIVRILIRLSNQKFVKDPKLC